MWTKGTIGSYTYSAKVYEASSDFGINKGRISKLTIRRNGKVTCSYDRGWDVKPTTIWGKVMLRVVMARVSRTAA